MKFRWVDMSGCEEGYNFYRRKSCVYDNTIQKSETGLTDLDLTFTVSSDPDSGTTDPITVTVFDPLGRECTQFQLSNVTEGEVILVQLTDLDCVFDGCGPLITLDGRYNFQPRSGQSRY